MQVKADGRWELRLLRARALQEKSPAIASALRLYERVLQFQSEVAGRHHSVSRGGIALRDQIDIPALCQEIPGILSLSINFGPETLRDHASRLQDAGEQKWQELIEAAVVGASPLTGAEDFFTRACLQPVAENLQLQSEKDPHYNRALCPACDGISQMAVLRPEGDGGVRSLICSFCLCEWTFRRVVCPACGEEDKEKLPRYSAEQCTHVHVEACDTCMRYIKSVDMTVNGLAVPIIDEAGSAVLDVWATERGYTKIVANLIGF